MKKLIKLLFGLLVLIFVLIVAAAIILPMVINPNDYKPQIIEAVKQQTGRDLAIEGDIGLSVFPKVGLNLGRTSLSNAQGFDGQSFASMDAVNIQVALMPLLDKKVEMDEIVLEGLSLNLQRNKDGRTNWDDLAKPPAEADKQAKPAKQKSSEQPQLESLVIGGIRIKDANILWQDEQNGQRYEIRSFNLVSGPLTQGDPVDIELNTAFVSGKPKVDGKLSLTAVIKADVDQATYTLTGMNFTLDATGETLPAEQLKLVLAADPVVVKLKQQAIDITGMNLSVDANGKDLPGGAVKLTLTANPVAVNLKQQTLQVDALDLNTLGMSIKGAIKGQSITGDKPQFNGNIAVAEFNARDVLQQLGQEAPVTADNSTLTRVSASFDLAATTSSAALNNLKARLDDTSLDGKLAVTDFASQAITFDLNLDEINLDRYLPPPAEGKAKPAAASPAPAATGGGKEPELIPVDALRKLNANGTARITKLIANKLKVNDIVVKVNASGGKANIKPSASLYQGKFDANVTVDARKQTPALSIGSNLNGVQIEPLLKDLQGEAKLAGVTRAKVNVTAVGNTESAVKKTLNGNASFSFKDGALVGVNIAKLIRDGMAKLNGKPATRTNEPEKTDFSSLGGTAKITNGVVNNNDFKMSSPLLRITGAGKADLVRENLDYLLKTAIVGTLQGQGGKELSQLKGVTIPIKVTGPFSNPSYKPDLSSALTDTVKKKAEEKVKEKETEIKQQLQDKLQDKLKGLF